MESNRLIAGRWQAWLLALVCSAASSIFAPPMAFAQFEETTIPEWLSERMSLRVVHRRDSDSMISLVQPLAQKAGQSVVQVVSDTRTVALGLIVSTDGYVLTKHSELTVAPHRVRLADGRVQPARLAALKRESDLALLRIEGLNELLPAAELHDSLPPVGSFLISVDRGGVPLGIGVVGSSLRRVTHQGRLGVHLQESQGRATVQGVLPDSGADDAGVVPGDQIVAINGRPETGREAVMRVLRNLFPGENVTLTISRGGEQMELTAKIRDFSVMQESENDSKVNGPRSVRLSGFERVIQHDTVLEPNQCGGPIIDSQGRVVGINIARAGRVVSYALPASVVIADMVKMLNEARTNSMVTR